MSSKSQHLLQSFEYVGAVDQVESETESTPEYLKQCSDDLTVSMFQEETSADLTTQSEFKGFELQDQYLTHHVNDVKDHRRRWNEHAEQRPFIWSSQPSMTPLCQSDAQLTIFTAQEWLDASTSSSISSRFITNDKQ
ncbi:hypothetical protein OIO90_003926 [Microbotryomycetes sp. JL221]|nr:hypothetical protein OIO90_003926 [Microbotryomycetes sp. JL221]